MVPIGTGRGCLYFAVTTPSLTHAFSASKTNTTDTVTFRFHFRFLKPFPPNIVKSSLGILIDLRGRFHPTRLQQTLISAFLSYHRLWDFTGATNSLSIQLRPSRIYGSHRFFSSRGPSFSSEYFQKAQNGRVGSRVISR